MTANSQHVIGLPQIGPAVRELEFNRQRPAAGARVPHIGVDALNKRVYPEFRFRRVCSPFCLHVAAVQEQPCSPILRHVGGPQRFRKQSKTALAPQIDLPKTIARRVITLQEEGIGNAGRKNVSYAPMVNDDFSASFESGHGPAFMADSG